MFKSNQLVSSLPSIIFFVFFFLTLLCLFVCFWCQVIQLRYVSSAELIIEVIFLELIHFTRIWKIQEKILNSTLQLLMQSLEFKKAKTALKRKPRCPFSLAATSLLQMSIFK